MNQTTNLALGSIAVGAVVLGLKAVAYWLTGSIALYSDALESTVNVATAIAALVAVRVSAKPADAGHPYGHDKAEYFAAVLEGVMIVVAALSILRAAYFGFLAPRALDAPWEGLLINCLASVLNGVWCWILIRHGRRLRSPALVADGRHLLSDVLSSVGVVLGVTLVAITGIAVLDPIVAALVAVNILWSGWKLMKESVSGLMDEAVPERELARIKDLIATHAEGAIEAHDIRTRHAGKRTFIDFHLVVPGQMPVSDAHDICDRIEQVLKTEVDHALITIHVEPENKAKHAGIVIL